VNLFVDALANYLVTECDQVLKTQDGANKITLVIQSFPLADTVAVVKKIDDFFVARYPGTPRALKITLGLWSSWSVAEKQALGWSEETVQEWVDVEDQLVTFRNEGHCIFFGFDHASEKGSLKDFHLVTEELLWTRVLSGRFNQWVDQFANHFDDSDDAGKQHLLLFLESTDKFNPRNLSRISRFLCSVLAATPDSLRDAVRDCYSRLPEWDAMPLVDVPVGRNLPRLNKLVDSAHRFSTHAMFTSRAEREKAITKIDKAEAGAEPYLQFELPPSVLSDANDYSNTADYLADARLFIRDNDSAALDRLKQWDATALLALLAKPDRKQRDPAARYITLKGYSDAVFLQAIQIALEDFVERGVSGDDPATIDNVTIRIERYTSDGREPQQEICRLLQGIVGGAIPEILSFGESGHSVKVVLDGLDEIVIPKPAKGAARVEFSVIVSADTEPVVKEFVWPLPASHPERLRLALAEQTLNRLANLTSPRLPVFHIGGFDELFFAIDEEDANRLLLLGVNDFTVKNVFDGLALEHVSAELVSRCTQLTALYREHLEQILSTGFYSANVQVHRLISAYSDIVSDVIGHHILGAEHVLPRLYRSFLTVRANDGVARPYLDAALVLPISPFVLELSAARAVFLRDGFREVVTELFENGRQSAQQKWQRLVGLAELRRPIVALVADANSALTTWSRSFGLTHLIGSADEQHLSVASQSLMREESFNEDDLGQKLKSTANSRIYERLIRDYQKLHLHANDQLSILFTHAQEIDVLLSGVDRWLTEYLTENAHQDGPFVLCVKVITTGVAATTALNMLVAWKNVWCESEFRDQRRCVIQIGHRHATSRSELNRMLEMEGNLSFDLAFLSHFMEGKHAGDQLELAPQFDAVQGSALRQFPIAEYPRPAIATVVQHQRKTLISNRRFAMASKHTEISARLKVPQTAPDAEHVVMTQIDFTPWSDTVALLHQKALWVSCVDRHVDSNLLASSATGSVDGDRRIVGFSCGLGNYGELNQTVSTELNDVASLTRAIAGRLRGYLKEVSPEQAELAARNVVRSASEIPGLSLVRAAGHDDYIRDVLGYSLVNRLFGRAQNTVLQVLIPLDSFRHWFVDRDDPNIPDLLLLSANLVDGMLDISATVIECKFASESHSHLEKAFAQASAGLRQLTRIFAPHGAPIDAMIFERKYWWAQLHRALSSRAIVTMPHDKYRELCAGLERLGEGIFSISWRAIAATFWTDREQVNSSPTFMGAVDVGSRHPVPNGFGVYQLQFGADAVIRNLTQESAMPLEIPGEPLVLCAPADQRNNLAHVEQRKGGGGGPTPVFDGPTALHTPTEQNMSAAATQPEPVLPGASPSATTTALDVEMTPSAPLPAGVSDEALAVSIPAGQHCTAAVVDRILLGVDNRGQSVHWEFGDPELENRHMLIFGGSGSGKTYAIQCLLLELAKQGQHAAIIDYTDGFLPSHLDPVFVERTSPTTHVLVRQPFPINPFQRLAREEPGIGMLLDQPHNVASRVSDVFCSVYDVGDVQRAALAKHIELGLTNGGDFGLEELLASLSDDKDAPPTLALKIAELVKQKPFANSGESGWHHLFEGLKPIHILQLTNLSKDIQRLIAEFALWDFFAYASRHGGKDRPLPIVLDEVQNLDHRTDRALDKLLREGRKFGVGMVLATQTISNFNKEQRSRLFQSGHKLFFKPAETERREFAQILADVAVGRSRDDWIAELAKLGKGECWSIGPRRIASGGTVRRDPVKLKISSLESR
jgi:DNA phosphorothioation-dependent restriction protein DptH